MTEMNTIDVHKAKKLLEINKMLTKSLNIEEILKNVIQAASELLGVSGVFIIYLYDEKTNTLRFAEGYGVKKEHFRKVAFAPGESICGKIFNEMKSKLFTSEAEINEYMKDMSEENYKHFYEGVNRRKIKRVFVVPIVNKDRCHGVVIVDHFKKNGVFTAEDMQVIEVVADQSAIAIDNSKVYQHLKRKNSLLKQSISIHNQFYQLIIEGRGIENVISLLEKIIKSEVVFDFSHEKLDEEHVFPIVKGNDVLGLLRLSKPFKDFSYMNQIAIEQASLSIALELIKENAVFEKEIHFREELFNQLMEGVSGRDLQHALQYIKWKEDWNVQCIILEGKDIPLWKVDKLIDKERFIHTIERISRTLGFHSLVFTRAFQLVIIIPNLNEDCKDELIKHIKLQFKEQKIIYGIGRKTSIQDLSISYHEAIRSVGYAKMHQMDIAEYQMLGIERLLYEVDEEVLEMFMRDKLKNLESLNESFIETLQSFIKQSKNHKQTAINLHIHPNTLYYRLRKIEEVLEIDLDDEKDWIDLVIAFRLYVASKTKYRY